MNLQNIIKSKIYLSQRINTQKIKCVYSTLKYFTAIYLKTDKQDPLSAINNHVNLNCKKKINIILCS